MVKFYTIYEERPQNYEVNDQPSLTDESFFEPLSVLVSRILRGESTTLDMSTANAGVYEYDGDVDDSVFDCDVDDIDDLTDIEVIKNRLGAAEQALRDKKSGQDGAGSVTVAAPAAVEGEQLQQEKVS